MDNIKKKDNKRFFNELLQETQTELHDAGKQLIEYKCNNNTEYIKFCVNKNVMIMKDYYDKQKKGGVLDGLLFGDKELKQALRDYFIGDKVLSDRMFEKVLSIES